MPKQAKKTTKELHINKINLEGKETAQIQAPESIFGLQDSPKLLALYVRVYLMNQRQGNAQAKTRSDVTGSTRKIYRQKGTGRARHGAKSAPIFVGGGAAHGPKARNIYLKLNKKQRRKALYISLSGKLKGESIAIIEGIDAVGGKTAQAEKLINGIEALKDKKITLVYSQSEAKSGSIRPFLNLGKISLVNSRLLNAYDVIKGSFILFTNQAYEDFTKFRLTSEKI